MASVRFADVQSRPTEFLDFTSLTCDFSHSAVGISSHYVAVSPGSAWQAFEGQLCRK